MMTSRTTLALTALVSVYFEVPSWMRAYRTRLAFTFDHLGSGKDILAVVVPKEFLTAARAKAPGEIVLSAKKAVRDVGVIRIEADWTPGTGEKEKPEKS